MARPHDESILGDQELVRAIGEINVMWDEIEMYLWYKFDTLLDVHWRSSYAIFFKHQNHRVRREMVEALAQVVLKDKPKKLKALTKMLARVKKIARKRNEITHGVWNQGPGGSTEIYRLPIKSTFEKAVPYLKRDFLALRDEIRKLQVEFFTLSYIEWEKERLPKFNWSNYDPLKLKRPKRPFTAKASLNVTSKA
jgi:hypothetical protein